MQITSAMKMVSAAKLKRAQDAVVQMRPYAQRLKGLMENASAGMDAGENKYLDRKSTRLNSSHEWISRMPSSA